MLLISLFPRLLLGTTLTLFLFTPQLALSSCDVDKDQEKLSISLVAPSGAVKPDIVEIFCEAIANEGCVALLPDHYQDTTKAPYGYYSESDEVRAKLFIDALNNEDTQAIWALRGGCGSQAVVRALKTAVLDFRSSKSLVGFSDFTLLGLYCHNTFGDHFLHGPMYYGTETKETSGATIGSGTSLKVVTDILKGKIPKLTYMLTPLNDKAKEITIDDSYILGGNLSVIQRNAFGLLADLSFEGSILFLEDTSQDVNRFESILYGLFESGRFTKVQGIFFGNIPLTGGSFEDFIKRFKSFLSTNLYLDLPLYHSVNFGHGLKNNPIPMGTPTTIEPTDFGSRLVVKNFDSKKG